MPKDTLPSISELEASMKYDVNKASGGVLDEETTRDVLLPFSASIRDLNFDFTLDVEEGELNKVAEVVVVNFTATELLVADPVRAYRTFAWHGTKLIPIAVQDGSWHFVDLVLTRCPRALLRNELRFMYFDNDPDTGSEIYKSLLYIALTQNRLIQVRVIVDCWISLLNENTGYAYDQIYMPGLCLPQEDLLLLSTVSPLEFERLVSSVKTKRAHNLVFGGKTAFPLRRPMVDGVMSPWECEAFWSTKFSRIHAKSRAIANAREERKVALNKIWRHFERMNVQHWLSLFALLKEIVRINVSNVIDRYVFPDVDTEEANQIATETEDLPDKLATGYFSPIVHCAHEKFFDACIEVCNKLDRNLLFDAPVVTLALKYSWTRFGRANHLRQCYKMAGFLILFALACFGFGVSQFDGSDGWIKFWVLGYVPQFLLLAVDLKFVWDELEQWRYGGDSLFEHFVLDIWNTFDGCAYLCILLGTVSRILLARDTDLSRELLACASVLMSAKLMYFFRAFESTGHLVAYMVQIIKGIGYFLYILFFIVIGFAGAFWLLSVGDTNSQCSSVDGAVFTTFTYLIGADAAPDIDASDRNQFYRFTYVLYIIVTMVVLLNLLIAIMGDIYGRAHAVAPAQFRWEQANVISDNMFLLTAEERRQFRVDPLVVHYLTAKNPLEKDDDNNAIDDSFEQNGSELGTLKKQLLELTGKHESAMAALRSECNEQALELKMEQLKTNELLQSLIYEIKSKK